MRAFLGVVEAQDQADQGRLAGSGRPHDGHALARLRVERDLLERRRALVVGEAHVLEGDAASRPADLDRVPSLLHRRLGVEQVQRHAQCDEVELQAADRLADLLERLVDGSDVAR